MLTNPIDIHIGQRIKELRTTLKISQEQLGELVGITLQQIQKYEIGKNRISASRLYEIAQLLGKPISSFFDDYVNDTKFHNFEFTNDAQRIKLETARSKEVLELIINFNRIKNIEVRNNIINLVRSVAQSQ